MHERKKILFVDDEPMMLSSLRRAFLNKSGSWDTYFAESGEDALKITRQNNLNVIVSDMRMPNMDGAKLLQMVKDISPNTIRIVLSGQSDLEMVMRIVNIAHQFMIKPCSPKHLEEVIDRSFKLQEILNNTRIKNIIGKVEGLPSLPKTYQELTIALENPKVTSEQVAEIIEQDVAMSAKILQLSNSAFFGLPHHTTSILRAINYIGFDTLKNLTLGAGVFNTFEKKSKYSGEFLESMQIHSLECANLASRLLSDPAKSKDAFLAGLLHDIGKLVILTYFPEKYKIIHTESIETKEEIYVIERRVLGVTHAEVGGYLLGIWGLPYAVVEAVIFHHEPLLVPQREFGVLGAVYVANCLLHKSQFETLNMEYLKDMGVDSKLSKWQDMATSLQKKH